MSSSSKALPLPHCKQLYFPETTGDSRQPLPLEHTRVVAQKQRHPRGCTRNKCLCSCHTLGSMERRFWSFQYTPLSMILRGCDDTSCDQRHYYVSIRVALSQLGLPWACTLSFHFENDLNSFSLYPCLKPQIIVRYTSPGFKLLEEIRRGEVELAEGIKQFTELLQQDPDMRSHVNPAGRGYVQVCICMPGCFAKYHDFS